MFCRQAHAAGAWTGYAVIVGVADYPGALDDLSYCDDDAREITRALLWDQEHWSESNIDLMVNAEAVAADIKQKVSQRLAQAEAAGPGGVFLFFFSGHGGQVYDPSAEESDHYDETLYAWDQVDITDDELGDLFAGTTCGHICVMIDVCDAGGMAKSVGGLPGKKDSTWTDGFAGELVSRRAAARGGGSGRKDLDDVAAGIVVLMSSDAGQSSWEDDILENGIFSFYIVDALNLAATDTDTDGFTSAQEVYAYMAPRVTAYEPDQVPQIYDAHAGPLNLVNAMNNGRQAIVTEEDLPFGGGCLASAPSPRAAAGGGWSHWALAAALAALAARRRAIAAMVALIALAAGCAPGPAGATWPQRAELAPAAAFPLAAATEVEGHGMPPMPALRARRFGVRTGFLAPLAEKNLDYLPAVPLGAFVSTGSADPRVALEAGVDTFRLEGGNARVEASVLSARVDALFARPPSGEPAEVYLAAGARVIVDVAKPYWGVQREVVPALSVGVGARTSARQPGLDARLVMDLLLWSGNIQAFAGIYVAAGF